jgi:hypothetical protein
MQIVAAWEEAAREQRRREAERQTGGNAWLMKYRTVGDVPPEELSMHLAARR